MDTGLENAEMKTCYLCKGPVEPGEIDYMANRAGSYTLVKGLTVEQCSQCGEVYLDGAASKRIDAALAAAATTHEHLDVPVVQCRPA